MRARPDMARGSKTAETPDGFVCLCIIGPPHGVRGAVKAKCFTDELHALTAYGPLQDAAGQSYKITSAKADKIGARLTIEGIGERNAAEALRGTALFVARDKLPKLDDDDFYHADLIGLAVISETGAAIGTVAALHNFGAGDLLEVEAETKGKQSVFYPFTKAVVPEIDLTEGRLVLCPPQETEARPPEQEAGQNEAENK